MTATATAFAHTLRVGDKPSFSDWRADRDRREQAQPKVELPSENND